MTSPRRNILATIALLTASALGAGEASAQAPALKNVRVGFLHTELIDVPLAHGIRSGYFRDPG